MILSFLFGLCLILLLLVILQWRHLQSLRRARSEREQATQKKTQLELIEGLNTLLLCVIQDQVDLSEGVIRIKIHLDHLYPLEEQRKDFAPIYEFYDLIREFDTHQARKELTTQERFDQDKKRLKLEQEYRDSLLKLARSLYPVKL